MFYHKYGMINRTLNALCLWDLDQELKVCCFVLMCRHTHALSLMTFCIMTVILSICAVLHLHQQRELCSCMWPLTSLFWIWFTCGQLSWGKAQEEPCEWVNCTLQAAGSKANRNKGEVTFNKIKLIVCLHIISWLWVNVNPDILYW